MVHFRFLIALLADRCLWFGLEKPTEAEKPTGSGAEKEFVCFHPVAWMAFLPIVGCACGLLIGCTGGCRMRKLHAKRSGLAAAAADPSQYGDGAWEPRSRDRDPAYDTGGGDENPLAVDRER